MNPTLFLTALVLVSLSPLHAAEPPRATILETKTISRQPDLYHGWPTVVRRQNGELWLSWSGGRESHVCPSGQVCAMTSRDDGKSWTVPHSIGVWGLPSHLLRLRDGRLLMTYGHRRQPFGNQARFSADHGRTWSEPVAVSADVSTAGLGYPSTVEPGDGTLLTVWYEARKDQPRAVLRQSKRRLE